MPPELEDIDDDEHAEELPEKINVRLHFFPLPNYDQDRRFDPRARGELVAVLPYSEDYAEKLKKIAPPGWYAVEERDGGKIVDRYALEIRPEERRPRAEAPAAPTAPATVAGGLSIEAVSKVVADALEAQGRNFTQTINALREEFRPKSTESEGAQSRKATESLREAIDLIKELRGMRDEIEPRVTTNGKGSMSAEDELTLAIASKTDLLPTVVERLASVMAHAKSPEERNWVDSAANIFQRSPVLQSRAVKTWDRVLNRFLPNGDGGESDDGDDSEDLDEAQNQLVNYVGMKCAAGQPVSFTDAPFIKFKEAAPSFYDELLESLAGTSVKLIIKNLSEGFPDIAPILAGKDAPAWVDKYLKKPAVAELSKEAKE